MVARKFSFTLIRPTGFKSETNPIMPLPPNPALDDLDKLGLATSLAKARKGYQEGGVPIGAALVFHSGASRDAANAAILGCAHNQRIQKSSPTLHAEIAALEDAGRQKAGVYKRSTMVSDLPPFPPGPSHTVYERFRGSELTIVGFTQYTTLRCGSVVVVI